MSKAELQKQASEIAEGPYMKVIQGEPVEGFLAEAPDLPGCITAGETEQQALANLHEAMTAWLMTALDDGDAIPPPSCLPASGVSLVLRLPSELHRPLHDQARAKGLDDAQYALSLLRQVLFGGVLGSG